MKRVMGEMAPTIGTIVLMTSKNGAFVRVSRPTSMHHNDRVDPPIEQNAFGNEMTWVGMDHE